MRCGLSSKLLGFTCRIIQLNVMQGDDSQAYLSDGLIQKFLNNCMTDYVFKYVVRFSVPQGTSRISKSCQICSTNIPWPHHIKSHQLSQFVQCLINSNLNNLNLTTFQADDQTDVGEWQRVQLPELFPSIAFACSARVVFAA